MRVARGRGYAWQLYGSLTKITPHATAVKWHAVDYTEQLVSVGDINEIPLQSIAVQ